MTSQSTDEDKFEGIINLIGALFRLTNQDIKQGDNSALEFIESNWYIEICEGLQIDPEKFKKYILTKKVKSRISYE